MFIVCKLYGNRKIFLGLFCSFCDTATITRKMILHSFVHRQRPDFPVAPFLFFCCSKTVDENRKALRMEAPNKKWTVVFKRPPVYWILLLIGEAP